MSLSTAYFTDLEKQYINWSEFERSIRSDAPPDEVEDDASDAEYKVGQKRGAEATVN